MKRKEKEKVNLLKWVFVILIFSGSTFGFAQVNAPKILCLENETIHWDLPSNSCGAFVKYQIFWSNTPNGNFQLLADITDQNQTTFIDPNPSDEDRFYFMKSDFDCPSETILNSDTISNLPLITPLLQFASVENDGIKLQWEASQSKETKSYIIYKVQNTGTFPIDTVSALEYLDTNTDGNQQAEVYFIIALDPCDNTSIFGKPHFTTFLQDSLDICSNEIYLKWNPYLNTINGIDHQEVWINDNGWMLWASISSSDSTFIVQGLENDKAYQLMIKSIEKNTKFVINSNVQDVFTNPKSEITITNVTVSPDNAHTTIDWIWNEKVPLKKLELWKDGALFSSPIATPSIINNIEDKNPSISKVSYQLKEDNGCNEITFSNIGTSIFLSGEYIDVSTNQLSWTPFDFEDASFDYFEVYRTSDDSPIAVQTENTFVDKDATELGSTSYYVIAIGSILAFDGTQYTIQSRSNTITVFKKSDIFLPNAFAPLGNNRIFKPVVLSPENIIDFEMYIYDRWGKEMFSSDDIEQGWDGFKDGKLMTGGLYTYVIQYKQNNGNPEIKKGVVLLLN